MNIIFDERHGIFKLDTPNCSYCMVLAEDRWLGHVYYGPRLSDTDLAWTLNLDKYPFTPGVHPREAVSFLDCFPAEYPVGGAGDFRECALEVRTAANQTDCALRYVGHEIFPGKPCLTGLPATFGGPEDCESLAITLLDDVTGLKVTLLYTAFTKLDVITRSVSFENEGTQPLWLERADSVCLTLPYEGQQMLTLHGSWARERAIQSEPIGIGIQGTRSRRGESSHQDHPFLAITSPNVTQQEGQVTALHFVYSGSFTAQVQRDQHDELRCLMGIGNLSWKLEPGERFQAPEAVTVYSHRGLGHMTRTFHDLYRTHLIRSKYRVAPRPVLINNWEATYFDFNEEKIVAIAARAAQLGVELFVLDDGWFGHRDSDNCSLGDWYVDKRKLPQGLTGLASKINALGMGFGIWMEPEMISPDSDLYRAHPDWAIQTANRSPLLCREQLVLDLSRPEVEEYVWGQVSGTLRSANISYLKWDMNRPLTNLGSAGLPKDRQGELSHRYMLAVYRLQQRLTDEFPELLLENCSGGGARFDPGMLFYSPQIWCSDDTDAIERLSIQEGTALIYPLSTVGAHVSACPNHCVGRVTPLETRAAVAMMGTFGYELDVTKLSAEEQAQLPEQIARYHRIQNLVQTGDYYRLSSLREGGQLDGQMVVSKDRKEALVTLVRVLNRPNARAKRLRLQGLDPRKVYIDRETQRAYRGDTLMHLGLPVELPYGDFQSKQVFLAARDGEKVN